MVLLGKTPLDEVELVLELARVEHSDIIKGMNNFQLSQFINKKYEILSTEDDINLLYEPTISEMEVDLRLQFEVMGLNY